MAVQRTARMALLDTLGATLAGTMNSGTVEGEINYPQRCWDEQGLEAKFRWLARHVLDEARVDAAVEMVWHFEDVSNVRALTRLLA